MKKNYYVSALAALILASCISDKELYQPEESDAPDLSEFITSESKTFNVPEGQTAIVVYAGDTLAVLNETSTITVPKLSLSRAVIDGFDVTYIPYSVDSYTKVRLWQVICFEDSKDGDHDYNDLVIHPCYQIRSVNNINFKGYIMHVGIQPVAYGATKTMKLGLIVKVGDKTKEYVVTDNVAKDLFDNATGFVNTEQYDKHFELYKFSKSASTTDYIKLCGTAYTTDDTQFSDVVNPEVNTANFNDFSKIQIGWFIESDGERIYAYMGDKMSIENVDEDGYPYGIAFTHIGNGPNENGFIVDNKTVGVNWFAYPKEKVPLNKAYPNLKTQGNSVFKMKTTDEIDNEYLYNIFATKDKEGNTLPYIYSVEDTNL